MINLKEILVMLHHSHRNRFATIPASNHCFIAQKSTISGHTKAQNTMLSFAERIQEPRIIADAAREGGEERKQGAEEDGGDHSESPTHQRFRRPSRRFPDP